MAAILKIDLYSKLERLAHRELSLRCPDGNSNYEPHRNWELSLRCPDGNSNYEPHRKLVIYDT
jgi:hypothetical protein